MEGFFPVVRIPAAKGNLKSLTPLCLLVLVACGQLRRYFILTEELTFSKPRSTCIESPIGNLTRRVARYQDHPLSLEGIGKVPDNHSKAAVCEFKVSKHSDHFPHAMQQLYQCWSYWNLPSNRFKEKVLVRPKNARGFPQTKLSAAKVYNKVRGKDWAFVEGITTAWQEAANVTVTSNTNLGPPVRRQDKANTFLMETAEDARLLTKAIVGHYGLSMRAGGSTANALPRIGILNRKKRSSRSLLNVKALLWAIQYELGFKEIEVAYFEKASFLQQVEFFANIDILISPHGAQLTGIPFMPECGRILELFPAYYYYDDYFGSLAEAAGLQQYALYLSDGDPATEWAYARTLTSKQRRIYRNVNLCPPIVKIVEAVKVMETDWHQCCRNKDGM